jgi:hypothetical protein
MHTPVRSERVLQLRHAGIVSVLAAAILASTAQNASAISISGPVVNPGNGHRYYLLAADSWTASEAEAITLGGNLASIDDAAENEFIRSAFLTEGGSTRPLWIGLTSPMGDWTDPSTWVWIDGSTSGYRNWRPGQPDVGFADGQDDRYAAMNESADASGLWDNYPDSAYKLAYGVVEVTPEPASLALLGLSAALALFSRSRLERTSSCAARPPSQ